MASNMNNMYMRRQSSSPNKPMNSGPVNTPSNTQGDTKSCEELMRAIAEADFFAQDLKLYLDTHPDDTRAIQMFVEACRQYKACKAAFEDSYWPLTACASGKDNCWDWLDGNFPPKS